MCMMITQSNAIPLETLLYQQEENKSYIMTFEAFYGGIFSEEKK